MPGLRSRRNAFTVDIWPGFVDALSTLLMVIIFLLTMFVVAQFFLSNQLAGRDQALKHLESQILELGDTLALERQANSNLRNSVADLSSQLQASSKARDRLSLQVADLTGNLNLTQQQKASLAQQYAALQDQFAAEQSNTAAARKALEERQAQIGVLTAKFSKAQDLTDSQRAQIERLNQQLAGLRGELARIAKALDVSEKKVESQGAQIASLGKRLNSALARKVEDLSRYRSQFFGELRKVIGDRNDIRIVGDRFVFQSEVLFDTASAELNPKGRQQIKDVATALLQIAKNIPDGIHWILQVGGYTDKRPISTPQFKSNWELSTARALSVVHTLIDMGVPPDRLAATGYGAYQPIAKGDTPEAYRRNRRIEFKLTNG